MACVGKYVVEADLVQPTQSPGNARTVCILSRAVSSKYGLHVPPRDLREGSRSFYTDHIWDAIERRDQVLNCVSLRQFTQGPSRPRSNLLVLFRVGQCLAEE